MGRTLAAFALLTLLLPAPAAATILANWNLDEVIEHSDLVVIGTVGGAHPVRVGRHLVTEIEIRVERTLLGEAGATVVVSQPGGRDGAVETDVPGSVTFTPGDRLLLITKVGRDGRRWVVGLCLGAYRVIGDRLTQRVDVPLAEPGGAIMAAPGDRTLGLDTVLQAIARRRP